MTNQKVEDVLLAASQLPHLTSLVMRDMSDDAPGILAKFVSHLTQLRTFCYQSTMRLSADDTDALFRLPNLEVLRIGMFYSSTSLNAPAMYATPPSAEAAKMLTKLVELSGVSSWATDEILLRFENLKRLTRLY